MSKLLLKAEMLNVPQEAQQVEASDPSPRVLGVDLVPESSTQFNTHGPCASLSDSESSGGGGRFLTDAQWLHIQ